MKNMFFLVLALLFMTGCNSGNDSNDFSDTNGVSGCARMSDGPRKVMCLAIEAEEMQLCAGAGRYKDSCVVGIAELTEGPVSDCDVAEAEANQKLCRALMTNDVEKCFDWELGSGLSAGLNVRDCIDLNARKQQDSSVCDFHVDRSANIYDICGQTQDCEGQFVTGASDNSQNCKDNLQV